MAIKQKVRDEDKKSRVLEILSKDYKWESYLFVALSLVILLLGVLILTGVIGVSADAFLVGSYPTVFAWILIVIGALSLVYAVFPFFKTAWPELKKVKWPTWAKFLTDSLKTFVFLITFTLLFLMFDVCINEFISRVINR